MRAELHVSVVSTHKIISNDPGDMINKGSTWIPSRMMISNDPGDKMNNKQLYFSLLQ